MFDWTTIAIVLPTLVVAYIIFGIAGFGTALVAAPVLAHVMPIASVVPLLALLDFAAAAINGFQLSDKIAKDELFWLAPLMIAGSIIGVTLLISLPATLMMFLLGVFAAGYGIHSLFARAHTTEDRERMGRHFRPGRRDLQRDVRERRLCVRDLSDAPPRR